MSRILLLEDDPILQRSLVKLLQKKGYEVVAVLNGEDALTYTYNEKFDLYLFDINVPLFKGDDLLKELRDYGDKTPAIIISALIDIDSITKAFNAGCDDYIKKPFDIDELLIRVKSKIKQNSKLKFRNIQIDTEQGIVYIDNKEVSISLFLQKLLVKLIKSYPNYVSKEELLEYLESPSEGSLRVSISKLKQLIDIDIENKRGVGYKII